MSDQSYGFKPDMYPSAPPPHGPDTPCSCCENLVKDELFSRTPGGCSCNRPGRPPSNMGRPPGYPIYPSWPPSHSNPHHPPWWRPPPIHHTPPPPPIHHTPPPPPIHHPPHPPPPIHHIPPPQPPIHHIPPNIHPTENNRRYYWIDTHAFGGVPSTALHGGVDSDGEQIYVGRAFHDGDWIPAKVIPGRNVAYVSYDGEEHSKQQFQVLCEQRFDWVPGHGGYIPPGAVEGGRTSEGEPLYIGRVYHEGSVTVGKVHPSHGQCYIPYDGKEIGSPQYEILVLRT